MKGEKIYGIADKAWQVVVGCDPHMPCAPRCWARKTVARVVECQKVQHPERAEFFQVALTPDGSKWSGEVRLDEAHLTDPLKWRRPALIATGFHGDIGRLTGEGLSSIFNVAGSSAHRFLFLTKVPASMLLFMLDYGAPSLRNVNIGCSVMNQSEADKYREPMREIAALGWNTHVWYEPAIGAVNWAGWEFLRGVISGGESGANSRPSNPQWYRDTRDWCAAHGVPFNFKQWGDWAPGQLETVEGSINRTGGKYHYVFDERGPVRRLGKIVAGRLLDGRTWDGVPEFGARVAK